MCGVIAYSGENVDLESSKLLLQLLIHRGQDACGIVWIDEQNNHINLKNKGSPQNLNLPNNTKTSCYIGSTRYPTFGNRSGSTNIEKFAQPFSFETKYGRLSLCHNGQITNIPQLTNKSYSSDAEFICEQLSVLIDQTDDLPSAIKLLCNKLDGAYSVVGIYKNILFSFRDPFGIRPLVYGTNHKQIVISSESIVLQQIGIDSIQYVKPGELLCIDRDTLQIEKQKLVNPTYFKSCMFEFVYFASSASIIEGKSVYLTRLNLGKELAKLIKNKNLDIDYITPIPDTSKTAAQSLSEYLQIPIREGILKNRSAKRTFILPNNNDRIVAASIKYLFIDELIQGKNLLIVDDSIVRGLTLGYLVEILRKKGARSVHVAITNAPIKYPCYYGIDFATDDELISNKKNIDEVRSFINVDSLTYLTIECLRKSIDLKDICTACLDGRYPTPNGQYLRKMLNQGDLVPTKSHYEILGDNQQLKLIKED